MPATQGPKARPGFLFLACPDAELLLEAVEENMRVHCQGPDVWKRACFWGDEQPGSALWESLTKRDLFGSRRVVIVRQANLWPAAVWKTLNRVLSRPLEGSLPIFCLENAWDRGNPKIPAVLAKAKCYEFAKAKGWLWTSPGITDRRVRDYVRAQAKSRGITLAEDTLTRLCEELPRQAGVIAAELDKLALLADGSNPVPAECLGTAQWSPEAQVFTCAQCLINGDAKGTWRELARSADLESSALQLLGVISWHLRTLWQLYSGDPVPRPGSLKQAQADRIGPDRLSRAMNKVMDAETAIKTGCSGRQTVELLCADLLVLFGSAR